MRISLFSSQAAKQLVAGNQRRPMAGLTYCPNFISYKTTDALLKETGSVIERVKSAATAALIYEENWLSLNHSSMTETCRHVVPLCLPHTILTERTCAEGRLELYDLSTSPHRGVQDSIPTKLRGTLMTHIEALKEFQELKAQAPDNYLHVDFSIMTCTQSSSSKLPFDALEWPPNYRFPEMSDLKVIINLSGDCTFDGISATSFSYLQLKPRSALCLTKEAQRSLFERTKMVLNSIILSERVALIIDIIIPPKLPPFLSERAR